MQRATDKDSQLLEDLLGTELSDHQVDQARDIIEASGALAHTEAQIERDVETAEASLNLAELSEDGRVALQALTRASVQRAS